MGVYQFTLPDVGEGMHEGEIVKWHIQPGDMIEEEQIIVDVQNDKSVVELPSPVGGKVTEIKVKEGTLCRVGDLLAVFEVAGEGNASAGQATPAVEGAGHHISEAAKPAPSQGAPLVEQADSQPAPATASPSAAGQAVAPVPANASATASATAATASAPTAASTPNPTPATAADQAGASGQVLAPPGVRKAAREQGIDLVLVPGTGRHGQVTKQDLANFQASGGAGAAAAANASGGAQSAGQPASAAAAPTSANTAAAAEPEERLPLKGIRKIIADAMVKSMYTAPHVTIMDEVDVSRLVALRQKAKPLAEKKGVKLTYLPYIVKALVAAARQYPTLNASIDEERGEIVLKHYYNIGIAADTDNGLVVPVIRGADSKNIWTIAAEIGDLAARARGGKLSAAEMKGGTLTITNIGSAGGMFFTPVINYPEVAILGTGRISEKPVVRNGEIVIGQLMALSLSFDHRLIDGATAQYAMNYIKQLLEDPELLVMEV
jgi:pyruvate dehydrogenase E2 component (dihydrolipoamide acetyltransferase)